MGAVYLSVEMEKRGRPLRKLSRYTSHSFFMTRMFMISAPELKEFIGGRETRARYRSALGNRKVAKFSRPTKSYTLQQFVYCALNSLLERMNMPPPKWRPLIDYLCILRNPGCRGIPLLLLAWQWVVTLDSITAVNIVTFYAPL